MYTNMKEEETRPERVSTRKRPRGTPTGKTPIQPSKMFSENKENVKILKRWQPNEKINLKKFVESVTLTREMNENDWQECAVYIKQQGGSERTGDSCKRQYYRFKELFGQPEPEASDNSVYVQTDVPQSVSVETQTMPVLPVVHFDESDVSKSVPPVLPHDDEGVSPIKEKLKNTLSGMLNSDFFPMADSFKSMIMHALLFSDTDSLVKCLINNSMIKKALYGQLLLEINVEAQRATNHSSYLYNKDFDALRSFSWKELVSEMVDRQPLLVASLMSVFKEYSVPKMGLIYAIMIESRYHELNRAQRLLAVMLKSEMTHEKVFDRLQPLGLCSSYSTLSTVVDQIGEECYTNVIDAVKCGKRFRLVGDIVNFSIGSKFKRGDKSKAMYHYFASAAIVQQENFLDLPTEPQGLVKDLTYDHYIPTDMDKTLLKRDYSVLIARVAMDHLSSFAFLRGITPSVIVGEYTKRLAKQSDLIVLPVVPYNEQSYDDVVKILDDYQFQVNKISSQVGQEQEIIQIGGDQLTRERFSGAKALFLAMNFLTLFFDKLFVECHDKGTMFSEKIRTGRKDVHVDVKNHYDDDKDFALMFIRSYIVEALMEFFGMDSPEGEPTKNTPPHLEATSDIEKKTWWNQTMNEFIDSYVLGRPQKPPSAESSSDLTSELKRVILKMPDGRTAEVFLPVLQKIKKVEKENDLVRDYAQLVLELGLLYMELLDVCTTPDRDRLMTTLKYMMPIFKAHSNNSKYALEILRFLSFQQASYSKQTAHQYVYGLFVNNLGHSNSHIPADLQMEHLVKKVKTLLKSLGPNNKAETVIKRSKALAGMDNIAHSFDKSLHVVVRSKKHRYQSAVEDEKNVITDLREIRPYDHVTGRKFSKLQNIKYPMCSTLDQVKFRSWIDTHKNTLDFDVGK